MKLKHSVLLAFLFVYSLGMAQSKCREYAKYGLKYLDSESYKDALRYLDWAIELCPDSAECYFYRGICYDALQDYDKRERDFKKFLTLNNNRSKAVSRVGAFYFHNKEFDKSIRLYTEALNSPELTDSAKYIYYLDRGAAKHSIRDLDGALSDFKNAYRLDSGRLSVIVNISGVLRDLKMYDEAEKWLIRASKKDPADIVMLNNLGFLYIEQNLYAKAVPCFNKVIENSSKKDPSFSNMVTLAYAYSNRGFCRSNTGQYKEALKDFEKSIELYPENSYVFKNRALLYLKTNKGQEACEDLVKALALGFTRQYGNEAQELYDKHCR